MHRLWPVCLAALLIACGSGATAQTSGGAIRIGVLTDLSGPAASATGPGSVTAARMAAEDFGGKVLGKPIGSYPRTTRSSPMSVPASRASGTTSTTST